MNGTRASSTLDDPENFVVLILGCPTTSAVFFEEGQMRGLRAVIVVVAVGVLALPAAAAAPPSKEVVRLKHEVAILRAKVKKLQHANKLLAEDDATVNQRWSEALQRESALVRHIAAADPCPITRPNGSVPPGPTFGGPEYEGNGRIWVGLGTANVVVSQANPDGSVDYKYGWWRATSGPLQITGRRLDSAAPPLTADIPSGYGDSGFQATVLHYPTGGCWQVTGSVGSASLTFVTLVIPA
jgi:hypothetical protein